MWVEKYSINITALTSSHFTQNYSKKGFWAVHSEDSLYLRTRRNPFKKSILRNPVTPNAQAIPVPVASVGSLPVQADCLLRTQTLVFSEVFFSH